MIRWLVILGCCLITNKNLHAQGAADTTRVLEEVTVRAFESNRAAREIPAAVALLSPADFNRFSNATLVQAVNTVPGVRMEERSPGSYRISIRGSTLRSPFGVRNVKVYWNELPFTDPSGNSYVNVLDPGTLRQLEIIKGPGSSLYGAGTGGVLLLRSEHPRDERSLGLGYLAGSYGQQNWQVAYREGGDRSSHQIQYLHQQQDGYRDQSRMVRDMINSTFRFETSDRQVLETSLLYADLYYQTPGGLTQAEMMADPRQARPATTLPGAVDQQAAVASRFFFAGITHQYRFDRWQNRTSVYGNLVNFENATIRNYERRAEQSFGGRTVTEVPFKLGDVRISASGGAEFQSGFSPVKVYENLGGQTGLLQSDNEIRIWTYSVFGQAEVFWRKWIVTAGASLNGLNYSIATLNPAPATTQERTFSTVISPRLATLYTVNDQVSLFAQANYGFSPPTVAEILPSTGVLNTSLNPETGLNLETGAKGAVLKKQLTFEASVYYFQLDETIVVRRDNSGADYFVNAGSTDQRGVELLTAFEPALSNRKISWKIWSSLTLNRYFFRDYVKGTDDFSGNRLTGVPNEVVLAGLDVAASSGFYVRLVANYTSSLPLNDANLDFADEFLLLSARAGYQNNTRLYRLDVFVGGDNLLNQLYSLGNDLNATGGRFFNPAATRTFYAGLNVRINTKKD
jgi:iron complex outermembrane receptor protein